MGCRGGRLDACMGWIDGACTPSICADDGDDGDGAADGEDVGEDAVGATRAPDAGVIALGATIGRVGVIDGVIA